MRLILGVVGRVPERVGESEGRDLIKVYQPTGFGKLDSKGAAREPSTMIFDVWIFLSLVNPETNRNDLNPLLPQQ